MPGTKFTAQQFQDIYPDGIENHYWNHARNKIILRFLHKWKIDREPILEIGGGRGVVAKFLHDRRIDITSVELASVSPVEGTEEYFKSGTDAFELPEEERKVFKVVMLLDVIEHIEIPSVFVSTIVQKFPNLTHLLVTVPARQELWTNYDEFNGHYRRYSLSMLKNISSEIQLVKGRYFYHTLYPVFWLYARIIKERETLLKAPKGFQITGHRILSWMLQLEYTMLPGSWWGTSCIGLFKAQNAGEF